MFFFFQAEDGIRDLTVTGVQTCALPISICSKQRQLRAALPIPPYTTRSCGRSATSGSRLFISMRSAASLNQLRQLKVEPRGARSGGRGVASDMVLPRLALAARRSGNQ